MKSHLNFHVIFLYDLFYQSLKDMNVSSKIVNLNATSKRIIPIVHYFVVFSTHVRHFLCKTRSQLLTLEQNFTIISYFFSIYLFLAHDSQLIQNLVPSEGPFILN